MLKRKYEIIGIEPKVAKLWSKDIRDDIKFSVDAETGDIHTYIKLTMVEAIKMKCQMVMYNLKHSNKLKLKRFKGGRYGV